MNINKLTKLQKMNKIIVFLIILVLCSINLNAQHKNSTVNGYLINVTDGGFPNYYAKIKDSIGNIKDFLIANPDDFTNLSLKGNINLKITVIVEIDTAWYPALITEKGKVIELTDELINKPHKEVKGKLIDIEVGDSGTDVFLEIENGDKKTYSGGFFLNDDKNLVGKVIILTLSRVITGTIVSYKFIK